MSDRSIADDVWLAVRRYVVLGLLLVCCGMAATYCAGRIRTSDSEAALTEQRDSLQARARRRTEQASSQRTLAAAAEFTLDSIERTAARSTGNATTHRVAMRDELAAAHAELPAVVEVQLALDSLAIADAELPAVVEVQLALDSLAIADAERYRIQARVTIDLYRPALDTAIAGAQDAREATGITIELAETQQRRQFWRGVKIGGAVVFVLVTALRALPLVMGR